MSADTQGGSLSRRRALKWIAAGVATAGAAAAGYRFVLPTVQDWLGITEAGLLPRQWHVIALLVDEIFPRTETAPSAVDAGVLNYLARAIRGELPGWKPSQESLASGGCQPVSSGYGHLLPHYAKLAARLDTLARAKANRAFARLSATERSEVVKGFAQSARADVGYNVKGYPDAAGASDGSLFELARRHAIEGYFSDPRSGGNRDYLAWESIRHVCHMNYPKAKPTSCP